MFRNLTKSDWYVLGLVLVCVIIIIGIKTFLNEDFSSL